MGEAIPAIASALVQGPRSNLNTRPSGRFWVLAENIDEKDDEEDATGSVRMQVALPTPSDLVCKAFQVGYSQEEVAGLVDSMVPKEDPARQGHQSSEDRGGEACGAL
ncbi:hypothetical protein D1007_43637 [Hordeum vulgare]|nr:hypothetical protein D1007_43637 [Hordeum vulgare]